MEYKHIIVQWKEFNIPALLPRHISAEIHPEFITAITGPRRAGKTYFCFQLIQQLLQKGVSKENILYLNFEDNKLLDATADDLDVLLQCYEELSELNKRQHMYLFCDEIQTVTNWDAWVRKIHDIRKDIHLILTGSSSKLLSKEISTTLRGRVINIEILPLSFKELLHWNQITYSLKTLSYSREKIAVKKVFSEFISTGGYPALAINKQLPRETILQSYYDSILFKDIIERHTIGDVKKLKSLAQLLFESVSHEMSYNKLAHKLTSLGFSISKNTIIEYISYFEDAYLFFQNMKYEYSFTKQLGSIKKVYCIDNGLLNSASFKFSQNTGKLLENTVFIELKRRKHTVYYHRKNYECDFLTVNKNAVASCIQVSANINEENQQREIRGLLEALYAHHLSEGFILTEDQEETRTNDNKKIYIIPVWKWLLEN
jgi:predicted AAA+ superfamily ATPase